MNPALRNMLAQYSFKTGKDYEQALKEIAQHLVLLGLWRSKFYNHAAFYGGTAFRIFHGLMRFSEDLDFSLLEKNQNFNFDIHLKAIENEVSSFGFTFSCTYKNRTIPSNIESAFLKGNTRVNLLNIEASEEIAKGFPANQRIKIKLEVDTDPPSGGEYEIMPLFFPINFWTKVFSKPDLAAGKFHAVLCRSWKNRVKGRDFYDYLWFAGNKIPCRIPYLQAKMIQTGHWPPDKKMVTEDVINMLEHRFKNLDVEQAKQDVHPFIKDPGELEIWSKQFFLGTLKNLTFII
jgi:predicted nucleotidyltransferase component of viral defense system